MFNDSNDGLSYIWKLWMTNLDWRLLLITSSVFDYNFDRLCFRFLSIELLTTYIPWIFHYFCHYLLLVLFRGEFAAVPLYTQSITGFTTNLKNSPVEYSCGVIKWTRYLLLIWRYYKNFIFLKFIKVWKSANSQWGRYTQETVNWWK